jgi:hypothetical protein
MFIFNFVLTLFILLCFFQAVGESGLFTPDDVAYVQNAGVSAVSPTKSM